MPECGKSELVISLARGLGHATALPDDRCIDGLGGIPGRALIATFVAVYRDPSESTAGVASAVVLASLCLAALLAVVRRGRGRGAWAGMAIFGLGYLAFAWSAEDALRHPQRWRLITPGPVPSFSTCRVRVPLTCADRPVADGPPDRPRASRRPSACPGVLWGTLAGRESEGGS